MLPSLDFRASMSESKITAVASSMLDEDKNEIHKKNPPNMQDHQHIQPSYCLYTLEPYITSFVYLHRNT